MNSDAALIPDILGADVFKQLRVIVQEGHWTQAKRQAKTALIQILDDRDFYRFRGHPGRYNLSRIGESQLCSIPPNKRGHLKSYRGKQVCIVCVGTGRFDREFMVGVVLPSPAILNKLRTARKAWHRAKKHAEREQKKAEAKRRAEKVRKTWQSPQACGDAAYFIDNTRLLQMRLRTAGLQHHATRILNAMRSQWSSGPR
ncbi:MAG: hypothetical protein ACKVJG_00965 [Candidatus Latescibacterota bacterium]|mgnify:CR=1 FL=1|jgi:hypothetical protein